MIYVYAAGTWRRTYVSSQLYHDGQWHRLYSNNLFWHYNAGALRPYPLGYWPTYISDEYGWFPARLQLETYECTADTQEDPETGDTIYSNWRWVLMSSDIAGRAPTLENPAEYPQWRYYTLGPTLDFSVEVDPHTGHIVGYGADLHNPQADAPPPPAAGLDYYMDTITVVIPRS